MDKIIEFKDVSFSYEELDEIPDERIPEYAIKNLNFSVKPGECIAILGHNGSGKSTLAKLSNGILIPDEGKVISYGLDTEEEDNLLKIREKVGMVFQNPDNQIVATVVEEDVAFGPENLGVPPKEIRKRVDEALKVVGMEEYKLQAPHKLSGGQKQRVAIAGILAMNPECIIFDESTAMLDPKGRKEVMDTIETLHKKMGKTIVYITHYMEEAVLADRVIVMENGQIMMDGTPKKVFSDLDKIKKLSLDAPQSIEFSKAISKELSLDEISLTPVECVDSIDKALKKRGVTVANS